MSQDSIPRVRVANCDIAVAECLSGDDVLGDELEVEESRFVDVRFGDDAAWWALMNDFSSWEMLGRC
jgi:hypothetical protein